MKKNQKNKIIVISIIIALLVSAAVIGVVLYKKKQANRPVANQELQSSQQTSTDNKASQTDNQSSTSTASGQNNVSAQPPPTPKQPTFTKSSGNNGSIPPNVLVNFICNSEPGTTCQMILTNQSGKVVSLPVQSIADNGRGEYFTQWYWTSVVGTWSIIAQAKNAQGGISSSEKQTLVVK